MIAWLTKGSVFFFQAEDGIRDVAVTGVQTCALPIYRTPKGFRVVGKIKQPLDTFHMPVDLRIETEGNPETKTIEATGLERSEEHTSELQSRLHLVCRLLLEKKKTEQRSYLISI